MNKGITSIKDGNVLTGDQWTLMLLLIFELGILVGAHFLFNSIFIDLFFILLTCGTGAFLYGHYREQVNKIVVEEHTIFFYRRNNPSKPAFQSPIDELKVVIGDAKMTIETHKRWGLFPYLIKMEKFDWSNYNGLQQYLQDHKVAMLKGNIAGEDLDTITIGAILDGIADNID